MALDFSIVANFTPAILLRRRSDGYCWNVGGGSANTYTNGPTFANAKLTLSAASSPLSGLYTGSISNSGLSDGWHDAIVADNASGELLDALELYVKDGAQVVYPAPIYHAVIAFTVDGANTQDEYTIAWFKDAVPLSSGITSPTIQVIKRSDGTDLIASTALTQIGTTGRYKHNATGSARLGTGEAGIVVVTATIDGATRTFSDEVSRDS